jgi:hypothetical protein
MAEEHTNICDRCGHKGSMRTNSSGIKGPADGFRKVQFGASNITEVDLCADCLKHVLDYIREGHASGSQ